MTKKELLCTLKAGSVLPKSGFLLSALSVVLGKISTCVPELLLQTEQCVRPGF